MSKSKLSIIIPVYNCEKYIVRCLDSVLNQTYQNIEVFVIDDGSTDNTGTLCKKFISDSRFKYIYIENHGVSYARNIGINNTTGEYIFFIDADDYIDTNYCFELINVLEETNSELVLCGCMIEYDNKKELLIPRKGEYSIDEFLTQFIDTPFINMPWGKVYKRDCIKKEFNVKKKMGEDFEFNMYYLNNIKKIYCLNKSLYIYNLNNVNSLTRNIEDLGKAIYSNSITIIKIIGFKEELLRQFISTRINDYIRIIVSNSIKYKDYKLLARVISTNNDLKMLSDRVKVSDIRIKLIFNNCFLLLKIIQRIATYFKGG